MTNSKQKALNKPFEITSVCRADIVGTDEFSEEDALKLDDDDMEHIASKLADAYCDSGFWIDLPIIVEHRIESNKQDRRRKEEKQNAAK